MSNGRDNNEMDMYTQDDALKLDNENKRLKAIIKDLRKQLDSATKKDNANA